ncbi:hypothetical protein I4U23_011389 [Adineta vaga]|nr:hypothetical protein I4U23_011389 [Adineta vaga]
MQHLMDLQRIFSMRERYSWRRDAFYCDYTTIANGGTISGGNNVRCTTASPAGSCSKWNAWTSQTYCTDYSSKLDVSSGYVQYSHVVQMPDFDGLDILKCRWSNTSGNTNQFDECGGICSGIPGAKLIPENCTIVSTLTTSGWYAGIALQIEDCYTSTSLTTMSSVPLQFLFYSYPAPTGCTKPPEIIGNRPNQARIVTPINSNVTEYVIVQTFCPGQTIDDFITSSPIGMKKSAILNPNPVGFESPGIIRPTIVQGSVSPIRTVFKNQTVFSFQTTKSVNRPTRNGTTISFRDAANDTAVAQFDCGWAPEVTFTGFTTVIRFITVIWEPGHFYYITMESGVVSGTEFCGPESAPITDKTYWVFNIWNPAVSSTTTTTPFTTVTVTTKPTSTTSINTLLTTTSIIVTTNAPVTTTTATTSSSSPLTTAAPTTAGPTPSSLTTESTAAVMYPKDFEEACKQPIAIMTSLIFVVLIPGHALAMYVIFTKLENIFNPSRIQTKKRHKHRMKRIL